MVLGAGTGELVCQPASLGLYWVMSHNLETTQYGDNMKDIFSYRYHQHTWRSGCTLRSQQSLNTSSCMEAARAGSTPAGGTSSCMAHPPTRHHASPRAASPPWPTCLRSRSAGSMCVETSGAKTGCVVACRASVMGAKEQDTSWSVGPMSSKAA